MSTNRGAYLMAKMTAKGMDLRATHGGTVHIDSMHVAASCAGLPKMSYLLISAKYCDDVQCALECVSRVADSIQEEPLFSEIKDRAAIQRVAALAVNEWLTGTICSRCKGRKELYPTDGPVKACHVCGGTGRLKPSDQTRSRRAGISTKWWTENKVGDYIMDLRDGFSQIENSALWHIYRKAVGSEAA